MYKKLVKNIFILVTLILFSGCIKNIRSRLSNPSFPIEDQNSTIDSSEPIYNNFGCINPDQIYEYGTVIRVIDGDSIEVNIKQTVFEVRYIGINSPEYYSKNRQSAIQAKRVNEELLSGGNVFLFRDISDTDKFGRLLRYVFTDDGFVNLEMVKLGYADAKSYPPDISCQELFSKYQKE